MNELPKPNIVIIPFYECQHEKIIYDGKYKRCGHCNAVIGARPWCLRCNRILDREGFLMDRCRCSQPVSNV